MGRKASRVETVVETRGDATGLEDPVVEAERAGGRRAGSVFEVAPVFIGRPERAEPVTAKENYGLRCKHVFLPRATPGETGEGGIDFLPAGPA